MHPGIKLLLVLILVLLPLQVMSQQTQFITTEPGVRLEVLEWPGDPENTALPLIFLAGAGDTAHRLDTFAPRFAPGHHVYAITRRGTPPSSTPAPAHDNYSADALADDVLAVMQQLHIVHPVLIGHSLAGQELSSIASRYPGKIAAAIYLDAATGFAFYDPAHPSLEIALNDLKDRIAEIEGGGVDEPGKLRELEAAIDVFQPLLHRSNQEIANLPPIAPRSPVNAAIEFGVRKYRTLPVPILAIYACPHNWDRLPPGPAKTALMSDDKARCDQWVASFHQGVPGARIKIIPNADHYLYLTNGSRVAAEINSFLKELH